MLVEHSEFFKAACCNDWKEATSRVIKLPQIDADDFRAYLFWVHRREIAFDISLALPDQSEGSPRVSASEVYPTSLALAKLWLLADRLKTNKLGNDAIDSLLHVLEGAREMESDPMNIFPASTTVLIWSATTKGRSLRRLVIDYYASTVTASQVEKHIEECHPEFVQDLMLKSFGIHQNTQRNLCPTNMVDSYYHEGTAFDTEAEDMRLHIFANSVKITIIDRLGIKLDAQDTWGETPNHYITVITQKLQHHPFDRPP